MDEHTRDSTKCFDFVQEKKYSPEEMAEMLSCNLAETIHNKWMQASGKKGTDLYVAAVDDYVRAFLQVVGYYQFLKGGAGGSGPSREELRLRTVQRRAQRTGDPTPLNDAILKMPGAQDFCTRDAHFEGAEIFGSRKRKADVPLGAEEETHRPDTVNFSRPRMGRRVTRSRAQNLSTIREEVEVEDGPALPLAPSGIDFQRVTAVEETPVNEKLWHIARLNKNSAKSCWAQMAVTRKKCTSRIVQNGKSTPAPTYTGIYTPSYRGNHPVVEQFFFCANDIERCVKGHRRKWIEPFSDYEDRPLIPSVWPVKIGTNLTRSEIEALENAGFQLPQKRNVPVGRTFNVLGLPPDLSQVPVPDSADAHPKTRKSKTVRRNITCASSKHMQNIDSAKVMKATILKVTMIPQPGFGCIVTLQSKPAPTESIYDLTISALPHCNCPAFKETMAKFGRRGQPFRPCKHLYYVYVEVCKLEADHDLFIHAPTLSFNEVKTILESGILAHASI